MELAAGPVYTWSCKQKPPKFFWKSKLSISSLQKLFCSVSVTFGEL